MVTNKEERKHSVFGLFFSTTPMFTNFVWRDLALEFLDVSREQNYKIMQFEASSLDNHPPVYIADRRKWFLEIS